MFKSNKYKWLALTSSLIIPKFVFNKKNNILFSSTFENNINQSNGSSNNSKIPFNNFENNKDSKTFKRILKELRAAALFEDYADLFEFSDTFIEQEEIEKSESIDRSKTKKKLFEEETLILGDENTIPERGFIQVDINKLKQLNQAGDLVNQDRNEDNISDYNTTINSLNENETEPEIINPHKYFQKILIFKIKNSYYSASSFCGYDLTDLRDGIFLGNKIICPTCISEYNIETGVAEQGPNTKYLATFPVSLRNKKLIVKVTKNKIPLFSLGQVAEPSSELDPRHYVLIGGTDTVFGALDTLTKVFTGKISIITHKTQHNFIDYFKLTKSFFPIKSKHVKLFDQNYLDTFRVQLYDAKVNVIDGVKRIIVLQNGMKIPFDKVLIAVGSKRAANKMRYENSFTLNDIDDHANIHNAIIKADTKSISIIGNNFKSLEIACSLRRYLDAIGKENTKIYLVTDEAFNLKKFANENSIKMIQEYLQRNRIFLFRSNSVTFEENIEKKLISHCLISGNKYNFKLPSDIFIFENGMSDSEADFVNKINVTGKIGDEVKSAYGNVIIPDERMSLNPTDRYPLVFAAGNCSAVKGDFVSGPIRTENMKTNFQLGFFAALSMMEIHLPYDDVPISITKILDRNLYYVGNENITFDRVVTFENKEKEQFISYLYTGDKMNGALIFGFKKFHLFIREAFKLGIVPKYNYAVTRKDNLHLLITTEVMKRSELIECYKHKALNECSSINTDKYSIEDQNYVEDLMKRGLVAYNDYTKKLKEEKAEKIKKRKEEEEKARKEAERKILEQEEKNSKTNF